MYKSAWLLAVLALVVLVLVLPGCSGEGQQSGPTVVTAASPAEIAYHTSKGSVGVMAADGSGQRSLQAGRSPSWSPDRTRIAYQKDIVAPGTRRDVASCIFVMQADGSGVTRVTTPVKEGGFWTYDQYPDWSPDGTEIVFTRCASSNANYGERIEAVAATGGTPRRILDLRQDTAPLFPDAHFPKWSANGWIAFSQRRNVSGDDLQVVRSNGADRKSLLTGATHPSWSPDGTQLAYASQLASGPGKGIWIANLDAASGTLSGNTRVTSSSHLRPTWSPDAGWIAYQDEATGDIWKIPSAGGTAVNLSNTSRVTDWAPDWAS